MSRSIRDQVRLRFPRALALYQRHIATRIGGDALQFQLSDWAAKGWELVGRTGMHGIRFERDGIWIDDGAGMMWAYEPGPLTSTMWAELGVRYEQAETEALAARLPAGGTFIDVGANIGLHSVQLARAISDLHVLALEPVSATFELLLRNAAKNGVSDRIDARRLAVSDQPGTLRLTTHLQFGNFVVPDRAAVAEAATEEVQCRTLDDIVGEELERVDAIKCDVEGAELSVLRGATATLDRFKPTLLIEVDERWAQRYGHQGIDVFSFLAERGYGYERFVEDRLVPASGSPRSDLTEGTNFLFYC